MSLTSKQVDELRAYAKDRKGELAKMINDAANTIEMLSAKLHASQMERSSQYYHGGWIPCSERLPDIDEDGYTDKVLVSFDHYSGVEICEYRITDGVGRWYAGDTDDSPEDIDLQVIAWMPLPERYEGGEE